MTRKRDSADDQQNHGKYSIYITSNSSSRLGSTILKTGLNNRFPKAQPFRSPPQARCHLSMEEPPARNTMWRMGFSQLPKHEDDDYLICSEPGGFGGPECPPCGDAIDAPPPHPHEAGGRWATGIVTREYTEGEVSQGLSEVR